MLSIIYTYLLSNLQTVLGIAGFFIAYLSLVIPIQKYLQEKRVQEKQLQFQNYHQLIGELVGEKGIPKLDRQIAIAYELRNFPEYYEVTLRILKGLHETWNESDKNNSRLLDEILLTIAYIKRNKQK